jgi:TonB family protein
MIFRRLLETYTRVADRKIAAEGYFISFVAHAIIVGGGWIGTRHVMDLPPAESFTPVQYLIPKDRLGSSRPQREQVQWIATSAVPGGGFLPEAARSKDEKRLEIVVPRGEEEHIEKGTPPTQPEQAPIPLGDSIMTELQVDSAVVRYENTAAPPYPESLLKKRIEGSVIVQYVVDTTGKADTATFRVVWATHTDFAASVRRTLPFMRFHPAIMNNHRVAQLVQQPFVFKILDTTRVAPEIPKRPPQDAQQ